MRSVGIKQLQEFIKSDHWLQRYCILSGGVSYFEPPCIYMHVAPPVHGCKGQVQLESGQLLCYWSLWCA